MEALINGVGGKVTNGCQAFWCTARASVVKWKIWFLFAQPFLICQKRTFPIRINPLLIPSSMRGGHPKILNVQNEVRSKMKQFTWTVKLRDAQSNILVARGWEERKDRVSVQWTWRLSYGERVKSGEPPWGARPLDNRNVPKTLRILLIEFMLYGCIFFLYSETCDHQVTCYNFGVHSGSSELG